MIHWYETASFVESKTDNFVKKLLKIPDFDLQRCLRVCRAAELSKERRRTLEDGDSVNMFKEKSKHGRVGVNNEA